MKIVNAPNIDLESKVWKINDIVFGPPPQKNQPSPK
jgi:hypothetical protein